MKLYIQMVFACLFLSTLSHAQNNPGVTGKKYAVELHTIFSNFSSLLEEGDIDKVDNDLPFQLSFDIKRALTPSVTLGLKTSVFTLTFNKQVNDYMFYNHVVKSDNVVNYKAGIVLYISRGNLISNTASQYGFFLGLSSTRYKLQYWDDQDIDSDNQDLLLIYEEDLSLESVVVGFSIHNKIFLHKKTPIYFLYGIQSMIHLKNYEYDTSSNEDEHRHTIAYRITRRDLISLDFGLGYIF